VPASERQVVAPGLRPLGVLRALPPGVLCAPDRTM